MDRYREANLMLHANKPNETFASRALEWVLFVVMSLAFVASFGHGFEDGLDSEPSSAQVLENGGDAAAGSDSPTDVVGSDPFEYLASLAAFERGHCGVYRPAHQSSRLLRVAPKRPPPPQFG